MSAPLLGPEDRATLLELARAAVRASSRRMPPRSVEFSGEGIPALSKKSGAFVTLVKAGTLRGCIGALDAAKPLWQAVRDSAWSSAGEDPRFAPVSEPECDEVTIEISILSPLAEIPSAMDFVPGEHGIVIEKDHRRGVFLPKVAEEMGWGREETLAALCKKARLPVNAWKLPGMRFWIFTAEVFGEDNK